MPQLLHRHQNMDFLNTIVTMKFICDVINRMMIGDKIEIIHMQCIS